MPPSEEHSTDSEDESEIPNVLPQEITKATLTKSNHGLSRSGENANNQSAEDELQENSNEQLVPEPNEQPTQNRENAIATTDAQGVGGTQRIRRPPTSLAYGNLAQPTDCWGSINTVSAAAPSYTFQNPNPILATTPMFPMRPTPYIPPTTPMFVSPTPYIPPTTQMFPMYPTL